MSDELEPQSNEQETEEPKKSKATMIRTSILIVILVLGIAALAYELTVARPQWNEASETVGAWLDNNEFKTIDDVHKAIDKDPSETRTNDSFIMEKYEWRSGLLFKTHKLYVTYNATQNLILRTGSEEPDAWAAATPK